MRQLGFGALDFAVTLSPGDQGPEVLELQQNLYARGYANPVSGIYDAQTQAAVAAFQKAAGLPVTGRFSPADASKLLSYAPVAEVAPFTGVLPARKIAAASTTEKVTQKISPMMIAGGIAALGIAFVLYRRWQAGKKTAPGPGNAIQMGRYRKRKHWWGSGSAFEPFRADEETPWEKQAREITKQVKLIPRPGTRTYVDPETGRVLPSVGRTTRAKDPSMNYPKGGKKRTEATGRASRVPSRFRPEEVGEKADLWLRREDTKDASPGTFPIKVQVDAAMWRIPHYQQDQIRRTNEQAEREHRKIQIVDRKTGRVLHNTKFGRFRDATTDSLIDRAAILAEAGRCAESMKALREARAIAKSPSEVKLYNRAAGVAIARCPKEAEQAVKETVEVEEEFKASATRSGLIRSKTPGAEEGGTRPAAAVHRSGLTPAERDEIKAIARGMKKAGVTLTPAERTRSRGRPSQPLYVFPKSKRKGPYTITSEVTKRGPVDVEFVEGDEKKIVSVKPRRFTAKKGVPELLARKG